jgi:hypothetical protein
MKKFAVTTIGLALAVSAFTAAAQSEPDRPGRGKGPGGPRHHGPPPLLFILDTDKDGVLSTEEIAAAPDALAKLDKDGDGQIAGDELRPPAGGPGGPQRPQAPDGQKGRGGRHRGGRVLMFLFDTDGDGVVSAQEIAAAATVLLEFDTDGDGRITSDELRPPGRPDRGPKPE